MSPQPIPAVCYDLFAVSKFCHSVALAVAFQQHTRIEWVEHRDSSVINAIYTAMFWKEPPGVVEVRQASRAQIDRTAHEFHVRYVTAWLQKLHEQGPLAANAYIQHLQTLRENARQAVLEVFQDASQVNQMVAGELKDAIINLARIRLAGSVGVAGGAGGRSGPDSRRRRGISPSSSMPTHRSNQGALRRYGGCSARTRR